MRFSSRQVLLAVAVVTLGLGRVHAAGLLVAEGGFGGLLEIKHHKVGVTINNGIAVTEVDQTFLNTESRNVEALYMFPVPEGATIANFSMWINGKEVVGEVVEKERAREIYNSYKVVNRDPGLLEQNDFKTFEMRIFPIAANAEQRVRISYYQQLDMDHNRATFVYPLSTTGRSDINQTTTEEFSFSLRINSPIEIVSVDSPSHEDAFLFARHTDRFVEASFETDKGDLSRDIVLTYEVARGKTGVDLTTSSPQGEDGYFMATLTAGDELSEMSEPMDYVFLLDISGSMGNSRKLSLSRDSIEAFVESLEPEDRVELITFNLRPTQLFGELRQAGSEEIEEASTFLKSQQAKGGTVLEPALRLAYQYGEPDRRLNVVILSDGMTDQGEARTLVRLIEERPDNATVFAIGVGNDVNRPLLKQLAERAGGLADFISAEDDFEQKSTAFRRKLTKPAASNVSINFGGVDTYDVVPREIPNLYHGMPIHVYGRFRGKSHFRSNTSFEVNGRPVSAQQVLQQSSEDTPEIERMWALRRIEELQRSHSSDSRTIDQIVDLGERYSIVTPYTSFLVLENNAEFQRWRIKRRNLSRLGRDRKHREDINRELTQLRDQSLADLGPSRAEPTSKANSSSSTSDSFVPTHQTPEPSGNLLMTAAMLYFLMSARRRIRRQ